MMRLLGRGIILVAMNLGAGLVYVRLLEVHRTFAPWESFSTLHRVPHGEDAAYVILGSSHAARFAGCVGDVSAVQAALGPDGVHLAKTASGVFQQRIFLHEFYVRGNRANTVVYFIDPFVLYSAYWNEAVPLIEFEPIDVTFAWSLFVGGVRPNRLIEYARSKFSLEWYELQPRARRCALESVDVVDAGLVEKRLAGMYWEGTRPENLARYLKELDWLIELAQSNDSAVILMTTPTLLGSEPDDDVFQAVMGEREQRYGLRFYDFRGVIHEPAMFRDLDHLNTEGVAYFMEEFVAEAVRDSGGVIDFKNSPSRRRRYKAF